MTDVQFEVDRGVGRIVLDRPKALNALNHDMVLAVAARLDEWAADPAVATVLITGAGGRGRCAGGDVRALAEDARAGGDAALGFWADEYRLNAAIARYPKPYVAFMDGVVLGGGVGVSAHGSHRVVTERSRVGMPEVTIGFVPDVGGTYLLSRAPGRLGLHAALTGAHFTGADAVHLGLADHYVPSSRLPELAEALAGESPDAAVARFAETPPPSPLAEAREWIDHCYSADTVEEVLDRLRASGEPGSATAKEIETKSPTAVKAAFRAVRSAAALDLPAALVQEYRVSVRALRHPDFAEGVRAQVVDKDRSPRWDPADLAEVDDRDVAALFTPLGDTELVVN